VTKTCFVDIVLIRTQVLQITVAQLLLELSTTNQHEPIGFLDKKIASTFNVVFYIVHVLQAYSPTIFLHE